jgi:hypothetical protein
MSEVIYTYLHPEALENGEISLFGLDKHDERFELASVKDLRLDLAEQIRQVELGIHPDGEVIPWETERVIGLKEGFFLWDDNKKDFVKVR